MPRSVSRWLLAVSLLIIGGMGLRVSSQPTEPPKARSVAAVLTTVRDFGAQGDGITDDTAALQRAADGGGDIRFTRGTYRITATIKIDLDRVGCTSVVADGTATIRMAGPGPALKFIGTHSGTASPETVKENVWQRQRTPMVVGLEIVGDHPDATGVWMEGVMQPVVTRVTVRNAMHGIYLTRRARNVVISECHLYDNRGAGLLLDGLNLHQINVDNCHISYNDGGGIVVRRSEIRNLQIGTCDIEANMRPDGPAAANILLDTSEGSIREGAIVGCTLQHSSKPDDGANIRFLGRSGKEPHKVGYFSISANHISDTGINIHLVHARGVTITGNTFGGGHRYSLLAEDCSQLVVGSNLFDRNPDYPPGCRDGLLLTDCHDCTLHGLQIFAAAQPAGALFLRRCNRMNITGCTVLDSVGCGISAEDSSAVRISDCLVRDDRPNSPQLVALRVTGGRGNMVVNNLVRGTAEIAPGSTIVEEPHGSK